jgi:hypothetical protein
MDNEKQLLISRILAGTVPAYDYEAELIYSTTLTDAVYRGCLTNQELLTELGAPIDFVSEIKKNNDTLVRKKQKLFEWKDTPTAGTYRTEIATLREANLFLISQQYKFFIHSAEFIATEAKQAYLRGKYDLDTISERLEETQIRLVARSYEWFALHNSGFTFTMMTHEAIDLVNWTKRYDNIRQHPECPDDSVIDDDDLLDGWTTYISNKKHTDDPADGKEVFTVAHSPADIKRIQDKNSPEAKFAIKMRENKMMKQGELEEKDLPDKRGIIKF